MNKEIFEEATRIRATIRGSEPWWLYSYGRNPGYSEIRYHIVRSMGSVGVGDSSRAPDFSKAGSEEAIAYVQQRALEGSELHQRALAIHAMCRMED